MAQDDIPSVVDTRIKNTIIANLRTFLDVGGGCNVDILTNFSREMNVLGFYTGSVYIGVEMSREDGTESKVRIGMLINTHETDCWGTNPCGTITAPHWVW